jgi:hypothetical protein
MDSINAGLIEILVQHLVLKNCVNPYCGKERLGRVQNLLPERPVLLKDSAGEDPCRMI